MSENIKDYYADPAVRQARRHSTFPNRFLDHLFEPKHQAIFPKTKEELTSLFIRAKVHDVELESANGLSAADKKDLERRIREGIAIGNYEEFNIFIADSEVRRSMEQPQSRKPTVPVKG